MRDIKLLRDHKFGLLLLFAGLFFKVLSRIIVKMSQDGYRAIEFNFEHITDFMSGIFLGMSTVFIITSIWYSAKGCSGR